MSEATATPAWAKGYDVAYLKRLGAIFKAHDEGMIHGAFGRFSEVDIAGALERGILEHGDDWALVAYTLQRQSPVRDFTGRVALALQPGTSFVGRMAWTSEPGREEVLSRTAAMAEPLSITCWQEHAGERAIVGAMPLAAVKISAASEMRGVYLRGGMLAPEPYPPAQAIGLARLRIPVPPRAVEALAEQARALDFAQHYSSYNKRQSWTALALRGFYDEPTGIEKPAEMSRKWKGEHAEDLEREPRDTPLREALPAAEAILSALPCSGFERVRLMRLAPGGGELTRHADITDADAGAEPGRIVRLHIPLITNPGVVFHGWDLDGRKHRLHMAEDGVYYLDQRKPHTAFNGGDSERLHLVCDVIANEALCEALAAGEEAPLDGPELSAKTQAWIAAKPPEYKRPVAPDEAKQGAAEAIAAAREPEAPSLLSGFTNDPGGSASLGGASETKKNAFNPGDMAKFNAPGERERHAAEQRRKREPHLVRDANRVVDPVSEQQPGRTGWPYGEPQNGKRPDATLADAISPQMGLGFDVEVVGAKPPGLADKFVAPPFSVLDTRAGYWQERRRAWLSIGFRGETGPSGAAFNPGHSMVGGAVAPAPLKAEGGMGASGRAEGLAYGESARTKDPAFYDQKAETEARVGRTLTTAEFEAEHYVPPENGSESIKTGTSVFDPVLCEVAYRWFSGEGAQVLDPFAGGVVRGAVAAILGRRYWGCELRPEQIADNRRQADALFGPDGPDFGRAPDMPVWHEGDSTRLGEYEPPAADLVFTCPPYGSLEVYSDDPRDLSTMSYEKFREGLFSAMKASAEALKPDRFAVWVVGEFRDKAGMEVGFVSDTVQLARLCGLKPYNSAILLNSVGSAALRAQMILKSRKLTRVHQHVLVFCKGEPKRAAAACGSAEVDV